MGWMPWAVARLLRDGQGCDAFDRTSGSPRLGLRLYEDTLCQWMDESEARKVLDGFQKRPNSSSRSAYGAEALLQDVTECMSLPSWK